MWSRAAIFIGCIVWAGCLASEWEERCWQDADGDGRADPEERSDLLQRYIDVDGDGYGAGEPVYTCSEEGFVENDEDCDDGDASRSPDGVEVCDGVDNDCDGVVDPEDAADAPTWYADVDGDGYGTADALYVRSSCAQPSGYSGSAEDCDDGDASFYPGADERCDGLDNDCDDATDEEPTDAGLWYPDEDGDGYGDLKTSLEACEQPSGHVAGSSDCDDSDSEVHPEADERCGVDQDCDGVPRDCDRDLSTAEFRWVGAEGDQAGSSLAVVDDLNGDGVPDVLLHTLSERGSVHLISVFEPAGVETPIAGAGIELKGIDGVSSRFGVAMSSGDFNGDGVDDLLVGDFASDDTLVGGLTHLFLGPITASPASADAEIWGFEELEYSGDDIAGIGDLDEDGYDEILIGAAFNDVIADDAGVAYLFHGPLIGEMAVSDARTRIWGTESLDYTGSELAGGSDLNGDGLADFLVGAYGYDGEFTNMGAVFLFLDVSDGDVSIEDADGIFYGEGNVHQAGWSLEIAGDVDGDGTDDVLVGAPSANMGASNTGAAYLLSGLSRGSMSLGAGLATFEGVYAEDAAGTSVGGAGDIDLDGFDDFLIGAPGVNVDGDDTGAVYLMLGPVTGSIELSAAASTLTGQDESDRAGSALYGAGDIDGDGRPDILIGAPGRYENKNSAGAAYLFLSDF